MTELSAVPNSDNELRMIARVATRLRELNNVDLEVRQQQADLRQQTDSLERRREAILTEQQVLRARRAEWRQGR